MEKRKAEMKKIIRIAKKNGWRDYCTTLNRDTPIGSIWKMAKMFKGGKRAVNNNVDYDPWINEFINCHSPPSVVNELLITSLDENNNGYFENEITPNQIQCKIHHLKNTAGSFDKVNAKILKLLPSNHIVVLAKTFNKIIETGEFPITWSECKVIPLNKPNKPPNEATSKRPISIYSMMRRLFESILLEKVEAWAENEKILSPTQYGFRKGRSTRDCIAILTADIKIAFENKMMVIVVFLDISAAYDNVAIEIMIRELNRNGAPSKICWLLWNLLKMKVNKYVVNGQIVEQRTSYIGLSQGLPIAPLCFNLVTCDIDNNLEQDVELLQFADDSAVYIKGRNIKYMETQINKTVKNLNEWTSNKGFQFSATKSEVMVFSRKHQNVKVKIKMGNHELKQVECFKYLGIILDRKLNFNDQIKSAANSAMKATNLMRSLAGTKWGMDLKCLDMLYKACIRSKLEFCSFIYPLHNKKLLKMERVQWKACRIITGCILSTHTQSLEVIAAVPPLKIRMKKMTERFLAVLASIINHPMVEKLQILLF